MSITGDRRKRDFEQREALILRAARDMFEEVGFLNLKIAELARRVEYSTGTMYQHFASKEDLLLAMATQVHAEILPLLDRVQEGIDSTRERMIAVCLAHAESMRRDPRKFRIWQFSMAHSVQIRASEERQVALEQMSHRGRASLQRIVGDAVRKGDLEAGERLLDDISLSIFSFLLGTYTATNEPRSPKPFDMDEAYALLRRNLVSYLDTVGWQPVGGPADAIYERVCAQLDRETEQEVLHG
jgi:AcrR family transcriptional regulator